MLNFTQKVDIVKHLLRVLNIIIQKGHVYMPNMVMKEFYVLSST